MGMPDVAGLALLAGLVVFFVGAGGWRAEYEGPPDETLRVIHGDRWRRAWIHLWMIPAMFVTTAGIAGYAALVDGTAGGLALMAAIVYAMGATTWVTSLAFRLSVVPWAAEQTVATDDVPALFPPLDHWAEMLYRVHMIAAYAAFGLIGSAVLASGGLSPWVGWLGLGWGLVFLAGFVAPRLSWLFQPPFWAHAYTAVLGVMLLLS